MSDDDPSSPSGTIRRFAWIVVNVRDLERSRAFYERFTPLRDRGEFEVTDASVFGVERGSFVASVMRDDTGTTACPVLLVQWSNPPVTGTTYPSHTNPGYFRICFQHPDAGALFDRGARRGLRAVVAAAAAEARSLHRPSGVLGP